MMGDFNARKGKLSDQIDQYVGRHVSEEGYSNLISHKLPNMNTRDVANPNKFGKLLVDVCMSNDLCMLNGRSKGDAKGDFTNYSYKGSSMIDHGIISKSLFPKVVYFKVHCLSFFSSHCPISFVMRTKQFQLDDDNNKEFLQKKPAKYVWVPNQAVKFNDILNREEVVSGANKMITHYLNQANENIRCQLNKVVSGVTEIIKDTASKCFKLKKSRSHKSKVSKRRKDKWFHFDRSLSEMKKQLERTAYMFKKHPKDPVVRGRYFSTKKSFKTLIRQKENDFRNKVLKQIALMESNNPDKFWNMVNELRTTKQNNYIDNIEPKKWYSWFKELNAAKN